MMDFLFLNVRYSGEPKERVEAPVKLHKASEVVADLRVTQVVTRLTVYRRPHVIYGGGGLQSSWALDPIVRS